MRVAGCGMAGYACKAYMPTQASCRCIPVPGNALQHETYLQMKQNTFITSQGSSWQATALCIRQQQRRAEDMKWKSLRPSLALCAAECAKSRIKQGLVYRAVLQARCGWRNERWFLSYCQERASRQLHQSVYGLARTACACTGRHAAVGSTAQLVLLVHTSTHSSY